MQERLELPEEGVTREDQNSFCDPVICIPPRVELQEIQEQIIRVEGFQIHPCEKEMSTREADLQTAEETCGETEEFRS